MKFLFVTFQLHKAWLEQRRQGLNRSNYPLRSNETDARITYLRKLIKFKNTRQPMLSKNDVAFVPDFRQHAVATTTQPTSNHTTGLAETLSSDATSEAIPNYAASTESAAVITVPATTAKHLVPNEETLDKVAVEVTTTATTKTTEIPIATTTEAIMADELTVKSVFTSWSNWTTCSRSCGGGVKSQFRKCVKRT